MPASTRSRTGRSPPAVRARSLTLGDFWPVVATPVQFAASGDVPDAWAGEPVELELWLGGEGFLRLSTGLQAGLDPFHHSFPISEAARGGERITIEAEVVPKGMFGSHVAEPRLERAHFVVPHYEVRALERDLTMIAQAAQELGDHEVVPHLLDIVEAAFAIYGPAWPSASDTALSRLALGYVNPIGSGVDSVSAQLCGRGVRRPSLLDADLASAAGSSPSGAAAGRRARGGADARAEVAQRLERLKQDYPPVGRLALTGHAHIDLAWLWPVAETRRKGRRTFATVLDLMERYPDFTFNQSSAQLYAWIEEDAPDLFARVKERVAEGRWEPIGGSWVEPDSQVTGGESFVRQLLYGQRAFEAWFGKRSTVAWLPDVFGFSGGIPQLLRGAGIDGFFTTKLNWNEENFFPYDLFTWEGIDGSRVTANMFRNLSPAHGYNGNIAPLDTLGTWRNFGGKRQHPESLLAFGWGDGGGGPSARMLENYARIREFPALPRLRMAHIEEYFAALPESGLPVWVGELYLEFHRGHADHPGHDESAQPGRRASAARSRSLRGHRAALRVPLSARRDRDRLEDASAQSVPRHHPRLLHRRGLPGHRAGAGRGRAHSDDCARCGAGAPRWDRDRRRSQAAADRRQRRPRSPPAHGAARGAGRSGDRHRR